MSVPTERADALVDTSRMIAASRSTAEIITLAGDALCELTGALRAQFIDPTVPPAGPVPGIHTREVRGHGRLLGRFELAFAPETELSTENDEVIGLISMVAGSALALASSTVDGPDPAVDRRSRPRGDRRKMDRDFIDHTRNGQVGFIVLRLLDSCDDRSEAAQVDSDGTGVDDTVVLAVASVVDEAIRQNDVTYVSGPRELSILLPGASKPETAMAADRIRSHLAEAWPNVWFEQLGRVGPAPALRLIGGVSAGRHEDPQRLAERALDALDEALLLDANAIVTDLGV